MIKFLAVDVIIVASALLAGGVTIAKIRRDRVMKGKIDAYFIGGPLDGRIFPITPTKVYRHTDVIPPAVYDYEEDRMYVYREPVKGV